MTNPNTPYNNLEPDLILDAVESVGFKCSGNLIALNSYENRVYQVGIENSTPLIVKFYRPHRWSDDAINEEHHFAAQLLDHEIPVVAPLLSEKNRSLHEHKGFRFALFPRQGGRALELDNIDQIEWMGRFIGRLHAVGACKIFQHRIRLDVQSYGYKSFNFLIENNFIPPELKQDYSAVAKTVLQKIETIFQELGEINYIRLHGDCHAGNILWNNTGPQIVDLDDCLMGPAIQDIWMLLSGNDPHDNKIQLDRILHGYRQFYDFNFRELNLIEALRTLRIIHYSAWLARRWEDPTFPLHFPWFNSLSYWKEQLHSLNEQLILLDKPYL